MPYLVARSVCVQDHISWLCLLVYNGISRGYLCLCTIAYLVAMSACVQWHIPWLCLFLHNGISRGYVCLCIKSYLVAISACVQWHILWLCLIVFNGIVYYPSIQGKTYHMSKLQAFVDCKLTVSQIMISVYSRKHAWKRGKCW